MEQKRLGKRESRFSKGKHKQKTVKGGTGRRQDSETGGQRNTESTKGRQKHGGTKRPILAWGKTNEEGRTIKENKLN